MDCYYDIYTLEPITSTGMTYWRTIAAFSGASVRFRAICLAKCRLVRPIGVIATFNACAYRYRHKFASHIVERLELILYAVAIFRAAR